MKALVTALRFLAEHSHLKPGYLSIDQIWQHSTNVAQIAREYQVHPTQVTQWKAVIRERLPELFEAPDNGAADQERLIGQLHQKIGELTVDLATHRVLVRDAEVHLTPIEYKLLTLLIRQAGKVLTHRFLLNEVWGPLHSRETHYLRVFMASLRRKIEPDPAQPRFFLTEQGVGYRLAVE